MKLSMPELAFIAATRAIGGAGIGLLLSSRMHPQTRRLVGSTLLAFAVVTTIPIARRVLVSRRSRD